MGDVSKRLRSEEGYRTHLYEDSEGWLSIGIGYNIEEKGLPPDIIEELFRRSVEEATADAARLTEFADLSAARQGVLIAMVFQMGLPKVRAFTKMLAALRSGDYQLAGAEMLDSVWANKQTPARAHREAEIMICGE